MNKRGNWTLAAILGIVGIVMILIPFISDASWWWFVGGIIFLILAFLANK